MSDVKKEKQDSDQVIADATASSLEMPEYLPPETRQFFREQQQFKDSAGMHDRMKKIDPKKTLKKLGEEMTEDDIDKALKFPIDPENP